MLQASLAQVASTQAPILPRQLTGKMSVFGASPPWQQGEPVDKPSLRKQEGPGKARGSSAGGYGSGEGVRWPRDCLKVPCRVQFLGVQVGRPLRFLAAVMIGAGMILAGEKGQGENLEPRTLITLILFI